MRKFKQKLSKEDKQKIYKIKKIKKDRIKKKRYRKYKKKVANQHFQYPSTAPTTIRVAFKDEERFEEKNGLRIPVKIPLNQLGDRLKEKSIHEYRYYKSRKGYSKKRRFNSSSSATIVTNDSSSSSVGNIIGGSVGGNISGGNIGGGGVGIGGLKKITSPSITIIDYNTLQKKTNSFTSFVITNVPTILFSVSELLKKFNIHHAIKIQYVSIAGFFEVKDNNGDSKLLGGELFIVLDKSSKMIEGKDKPLSSTLSEDKVVHKQMLQYSKKNNFLTVNNSKNYNNIGFKKKLYINNDTVVTISFLGIPFTQLAVPVIFNGNVTIAFNYMRAKKK